MIKFKKVLAIVLCLLISISGYVVSADNVSQNTQDKVYPEIAVKLGILDSGIMGRLNSNITRGELVASIVRMRGIIGNFEAVFGDVKEDHPYAKEIATAYQLGYINGFGDGTFRPDEEATYSQLIKLLVYLAGYKEVVETGVSVEQIAANARISRNISLSQYPSIKASELAQILVNVGEDVEVLNIDYIRDNSVEYAKEGNTIFSTYLNIYRKDAIVTANAYSGVYEYVCLGEGMISLNDEKMIDLSSNGQDLIGANVTAYVRRISNKIPELLHAYANDKNRIISVKAKDIYEFDNGKLLYEDANGKEKEEKINLTSVSVIYNGVLTYTPSVDDFNIETGSVELIDNNNDKKVDVVKIDKYENCIINTYDSVSDELLFKFGAAGIKFDTLENVRFISSDNKPVEIRELVEWDVVSIKRSKKNEVVTLVYVIKEIEGEVNALYNSSEKKIEIDGVVYDVADVFMDNLYSEIYIGQYANFYLDIEGKIASYNTLGYSERSFYYLVGIASGKGLSTDANAKIMDSLGNLSIVPLASKVELDGVFKSLKNSADMQTLEGLRPQIIIGKLNSSGALAYIDTADGSKEGLRLLGTMSEATYKKNTMVFYKNTDQLAISNKTVYMYVPEPGRMAQDDDYYIQKVSGMSNNTKITFKAYTDGDGIIADAIVRTHNPESGPGFPAELAPSVVNKVSAVLNADGEPCYKITLYNSSANQVTYYTESQSVLKGLKLNGEDYFPAKGDIVKISTNRYGEIRGLMPIYCVATDTLNLSDKSGTDITNIYRRQIAYAYKKDDHFVMTTSTKPLPEHLETTEGLENLELKNLSIYKVCVYDSEKDLITVADSTIVRDFIGTEGAEASKLFVFERYLETGFVCIYK